jgi:hypothetical protein
MEAKKKAWHVVMEGLIVPKPDMALRSVWNAFRTSKVWRPLGKKGTKRLRVEHSRYGGKVTFTWWGPAIKYKVEESGQGKGSGMVSGALVGHLHRHSSGTVAQIDAHFPVQPGS